MKLATLLTVVLVVLASISIIVLMKEQSETSSEYQSISYSFARISLRYDYSCDENVYGLYIGLTNNGSKFVQNLTVSVTNGLCVGSVPPLPSFLSQRQTIHFYVYTSSPNGTISVTGNNTDFSIRF